MDHWENIKENEKKKKNHNYLDFGKPWIIIIIIIIIKQELTRRNKITEVEYVVTKTKRPIT